MNSKTKLLAAFAVALAMLVPLSMTDSAQESDAGLQDTMDGLTGLFEGIGDASTLPENIDKDLTVTDDTAVVGDVKMAAGVTVTVESGASLIMEMNSSFSLTAGEGCKFVFEEGSVLSYFGSNYEFKETTAVKVSGKASYTIVNTEPPKDKISINSKVTIAVDKGTVVEVSDVIVKFEGAVEATGDLTVNVNGSITDIIAYIQNKEYNKIDASADLKVDFNIGKITVTTKDDKFAVESGKASLSVKASTPLANKTEDFRGNIVAESKIECSVDDQKFTEELNGSLDLKFNGIEKVDILDPSTYKNISIDASGSFKSTMTADIVTDDFTLKGLKDTAELSFSEDSATGSSEFSIKELRIKQAVEGVETNVVINNLSAKGSFSIDLKEAEEKAKDIDLPQVDVDSLKSKIKNLLSQLDSSNINFDDLTAKVKDIANKVRNTDFSKIDAKDIEEILDNMESLIAKITGDDSFSFDDIDMESIINSDFVQQMKDAAESVDIEASMEISVGDLEVETKGDVYNLITVNGFKVDAKVTADSSLKVQANAKLDKAEFTANAPGAFQMATINGLEASVTYDGQVEAKITLKDAMTKDIKNGAGSAVSASGIEIAISSEDEVLSLSVKGSMNNKSYANGTISSETGLTDLSVKISLDLSDIDIIGIISGEVSPMVILQNITVEEITGKMSQTSQGITMDWGSVKFDMENMIMSSEKITLSGTYTVHDSSISKIEGSIINYHQPVMSFGNYGFDSAEVTYTMKDGSKVIDKMEVADSKLIEKITVSGDVNYGEIQSAVGIFAAIGYYLSEKELTVDGDGRLIMSSFGFDYDLNGTVYVTEFIQIDGENYSLNFNGAYLAIADGDASKMTVQAAKGYTLDPESYEGFEIQDGYVVITDNYLTAVSVGEKFKLTIDGKEQEATYGQYVDADVADDVIWLKDSSGTVYGDVSDGSWSYEYLYYGDLTLTSVTGTEAKVKSGETVSAESNDFYFAVPMEADVFTVSAPSGLIFTVDTEYAYSESFCVSNAKTTYNGSEAYDITATGPMSVKFPVKDENTVLYHIINGVPVEMAGTYEVDENGQMYLCATLTSYSTYVLDSGTAGGLVLDMTMLVIIFAVFVVVIVAAVIVVKKKRAA
ncbi:cell surface protein [methanogenic archaeon mixed culture ISO4-G1]|nr:cell surface protein [methanogenic archaeon mixed culture ISO4-G1]